MKKAKLNLVIDVIMLIDMMALVGVGLLNRYVLLTGQEKWEKYGENLEFYLWGFDRHDWNYFHFILGLTLFGLLVLHIWFHWALILNIYKNLIKNKKTRVFAGLALAFVSLVLIIFPAFVQPETGEATSKGGQYFREIPGSNNQVHDRSSQHNEKSIEGRHHDIPSNIDINGSMTLLEVAEKYDVPVNHIKNKLNLPLSTSDNERLGRLRKTHNFTMSDVEEAISNYQKGREK